MDIHKTTPPLPTWWAENFGKPIHGIGGFSAFSHFILYRGASSICNPLSWLALAPLAVNAFSMCWNYCLQGRFLLFPISIIRMYSEPTHPYRPKLCRRLLLLPVRPVPSSLIRSAGSPQGWDSSHAANLGYPRYDN